MARARPSTTSSDGATRTTSPLAGCRARHAGVVDAHALPHAVQSYVAAALPEDVGLIVSLPATVDASRRLGALGDALADRLGDRAVALPDARGAPRGSPRARARDARSHRGPARSASRSASNRRRSRAARARLGPATTRSSTRAPLRGALVAEAPDVTPSRSRAHRLPGCSQGACRAAYPRPKRSRQK